MKKDFNMYPSFSVAMCVYGGDNAEWFDIALDSVINQTIKPEEVVLVVDGPVPQELSDIITKYEKIYGADKNNMHLTVIRLEVNQGHGNARRVCLEHCTNELIALMDADDICLPNRFEQQLKIFTTQDVDVVGGDIAEFIGESNNVVAYRRVPQNDLDIKHYMKKRCPFNQMTVMFKKEAYTSAGGYLDWYCDEDYYLWLRMMQKGAIFANTGTVLVNVRVGNDMYRRRGGIKYFRSEAALQKYMLKKNIISFHIYLSNVIKRLIVQVILPNRLRGWVFCKLARKKH